MRSRKTLAELRSRRWFGVDDLRAFGHRSRARQMGYDAVDWDRPIVGIINTWSDINQCHAHFPDRVQWVKRGILQAGGMAIELPALSLSEPFVKPTTMPAYAEALGTTLPGPSSIPTADSSHQRMAAASGRRAVEMVWEDLTPNKILTREAFDHATMVQMAIGGSTNAIIHAIAMAGRAGISYGLDEFDAISRRIPVIANIRPSGSTYLMEDLSYACGSAAIRT